MTNDPTQIDTLILATVTAEPTKTAVIISKIFDAYEAQGGAASETLSKDIAERLYILVDNGRLEAKGNMRRWRDSDIRLIPIKPTQS